jgi:hypothetical protein
MVDDDSLDRDRGGGSNSLRPRPPSQRIRTALRTSGGRFFYEGEGVEGRDGAVEGAADVRGDELEPDRAEEVAEQLRRARRALLEDFLQVAQSILDPLDRRRAEDLLAAPAAIRPTEIASSPVAGCCQRTVRPVWSG